MKKETKIKKDAALIEGKIDSKMKNSFEGEIADLENDEFEFLKENLNKIKEFKKLHKEVSEFFIQFSKLGTKTKECVQEIFERDARNNIPYINLKDAIQNEIKDAYYQIFEKDMLDKDAVKYLKGFKS